MLDLILPLINDDSDNNDETSRIYTDFDFEYLKTSITESMAAVKQGQVGAIIESKQTAFERQVRQAAETIVDRAMTENYPFMHTAHEIAAAIGQSNYDYRPRFLDGVSQQWLLLDTGSAVTVWPRRDHPESQIDKQCTLRAVNKTKITTYGTTVRQFRIGRKTYNKKVIIADIESPVVGWDFIKEFRLDFVWDINGEEEVDLVDKKACIKTRLKLYKVPDGTPLDIESIAMGMPCDNDGTGPPITNP